ncbi:protein of unknown function [Cupriavidus neocaledonicus]|uniref:Uncharacterized protein n=1 Tax=Cupriavidus neocaledonicus TaxID=1040979 RepID=A0A375H677_9BURK|nr:protein of unknown function [Cupriavidus neocaledonicus]
MGDEEGTEVRGADGRVVAGAVLSQGVKAYRLAGGSRPSPACGRGAGVRAGVSTGVVLEKTEGFARCGALLNHPSPRPFPHEGRGRTPCLGQLGRLGRIQHHSPLFALSLKSSGALPAAHSLRAAS